MVALLVDSAGLEISLSKLERTLARRKTNVYVPREQIVSVQLTDDPWGWLRGKPDPGTKAGTLSAAGTWRSAHSSDFVLLRKGPGVVIDIEGGEFDRLVLTSVHGAELAHALHFPGETAEL